MVTKFLESGFPYKFALCSTLENPEAENEHSLGELYK